MHGDQFLSVRDAGWLLPPTTVDSDSLKAPGDQLFGNHLVWDPPWR
jgi:hypothetical protein